MSHLTISEDVTEGLSSVAFSSLQERAQGRNNFDFRQDEEEEFYGEEESEDYDEDDYDNDEGEEGYDEGKDRDEDSQDDEGSEAVSESVWDTNNRKRNRSPTNSSENLRVTKRVNTSDNFTKPDEDEHVYKVLHRVKCHSNKHHIFKLFEDVPVRGSMGHLSGFDHLRHEKEYVSKFPHLTFLIIKEHYCELDGELSDSSDPATAGYSRTSHAYSENGRLVILSEDLKKVINKISTAYLYQYGEEEMRPPYIWLFHHRSKLRMEANRSHATTSRQVHSLLGYANERYGHLYAKADRQQKDGNVDRDTIPFLFRPNQMLVWRMASNRTYDRTPTMRAVVLEDWPNHSRGSIALKGWFFKHSSVHSSRTSQSLKVDVPDAISRIQYLSVFPFEYADAKQKDELIARGKEYWKYRTIQNVCYSGWDDKEELLLVEARLIVDYCAYRQLHPNSPFWRESTKSRKYDSWPSSLDHDKNLGSETYALFPDTLHSFLLKEKKWITIRIDQVSSICWNKKAFDRLVLPERTKDLIKSLVLVRTTKVGESRGLSIAGKRKDMIAGKGNGLIMLLHGAPGTGKTLTAERFAFSLPQAYSDCADRSFSIISVAEIAERPLYNVTCGDIGTNAEEVERYLKSILFLGKMWNCILLLDEADVFLEERSLSDLKRNSLVSVFLRTLEYYDGILILTSNRVGTFDEAFSSRIQVSLHFPLLDRPSRRQIWLNFLEMMREDEEEVDFAGLERRVEELSDLEINGRQIRNVLTTARQLAIFKMVTMEWEHVQRAIRAAADFTRYIQTVHGHTDEQNARDEKWR